MDNGSKRDLLTLMAVSDGQGDTTIPGSLAEQFGRLYEQYFVRVYNYVNYRVGDKAAAEELTSDVFNKAINKFTTFDANKASFSTWVFSIARNTLIDYYRGKSRRQKLETELKFRVNVASTSPEEEASHDEDRRKLRACLAKLNANEKELIALKFSSDMNNREIARIAGLSESNVGTILCRAIRKLRDEFSGWQHGE